MNRGRRQILAGAGYASLLLSSTGHALADTRGWPKQLIKVVIPYPAGGPTDIVGRLISGRLSEVLRQTIIIDNRGGASGTIGADMVAKSAPDGYTLLMNVSVHVINPSLYAKLPHDPIKDFTPITSLAYTPTQLLVGADSPVTSVKALVDKLKASPEKYSFASSSIGAPGHLAGELFKISAGVDAVHIPYKGSAPALTDLMGGQVTYMFDSMPSSIALVKSGKLRALAVTSPKRAPNLPAVPTMIEAGFPDVTISTWYGLWGPANLPAAIAEQLSSEVVEILAQPDIKAKLAESSAEGIGRHSQRFCRVLLVGIPALLHHDQDRRDSY